MAVSVVSLVVQSIGLRRMYRTDAGTPSLVRAGMMRTAACRVMASMMYVTLGVMAITSAPTTPVLALVVFMAVQLMWQLNAVADVRLRRRLAGPGGRHRR